jgi:hypothetical protein
MRLPTDGTNLRDKYRNTTSAYPSYLLDGVIVSSVRFAYTYVVFCVFASLCFH